MIVQCKATRAGRASAAACCAVACSTTSEDHPIAVSQAAVVTAGPSMPWFMCCFCRYSDGSFASGIWLTIRTSAGLAGPYQALDLWWYVYARREVANVHAQCYAHAAVARYGLADDIVLSNLGNPAFQGFDEQSLVGVASGCSANANVGTEASTAQFALWSGSWTDSVSVRSDVRG